MSIVEDELTRILHERSLLIDSAPAYRCEPDPQPLAGRSRRTTNAPRFRALASAAALTTLVAALAAGVVFGPDDHQAAMPANSACTTSSSSLAASLRAGSMPAGDRVISGAADGSALVAVDRDGATAAVDVIDPTGHTSRLWTTTPSERLRAIANPSGALTGDWAAFVLMPAAGSSAGRAVVVNRSTRHVADLASDPGYGVGANPLVAPIVVRSAITVLEHSASDPAAQRLALYWADTARLRADAAAPTTAVTTLLPVGGNVVALRTGADRSVTADFEQPQYRPSTLEPAVRDGFGFSSDGTTMRWLSASAGRYRLWRWAPGDPSPVARSLAMTDRPRLTTGPFAVALHQLADSATGRVQNLPPGLAVTRVDGAVATVDQRSPRDATSARIRVSALANC